MQAVTAPKSSSNQSAWQRQCPSNRPFPRMLPRENTRSQPASPGTVSLVVWVVVLGHVASTIPTKTSTPDLWQRGAGNRWSKTCVRRYRYYSCGGRRGRGASAGCCKASSTTFQKRLRGSSPKYHRLASSSQVSATLVTMASNFISPINACMDSIFLPRNGLIVCTAKVR